MNSIEVDEFWLSLERVASGYCGGISLLCVMKIYGVQNLYSSLWIHFIVVCLSLVNILIERFTYFYNLAVKLSCDLVEPSFRISFSIVTPCVCIEQIRFGLSDTNIIYNRSREDLQSALCMTM